jgi:sugar O-acyltransferase (sialic acid O-acetyltransferase NeuD family)
MSKPVVIFGAGDLARLCAVYLRDDSPYKVAAFTVHQSRMSVPKLLDWDVVPFESIEQTHPAGDFAMLVAVGYRRVNRARAELYSQVKGQGYELIQYVSSKAAVWNGVKIEENTLILENAVVQPFVRLGSDVVIWSGSHIGHDSILGDHCFIAPHAAIAGNVTVGAYSFIGVNATIRDGVRVGARNVIGAGAVIVEDTEDDAAYGAGRSTVLDVPSSRLRSFQ